MWTHHNIDKQWRSPAILIDLSRFKSLALPSTLEWNDFGANFSHNSTWVSIKLNFVSTYFLLLPEFTMSQRTLRSSASSVSSLLSLFLIITLYVLWTFRQEKWHIWFHYDRSESSTPAWDAGAFECARVQEGQVKEHVERKGFYFFYFFCTCYSWLVSV